MSKFSFNDLKPYLTQGNIVWIGLFLLPLIITIFLFFWQDNDDYSHLGNASYTSGNSVERCANGSRPGESGASYGEKTAEGIKFNVRTPLNYDSSVAHPLIVVYAPAGANRRKMEKKSDLTYAATTAGFIIAYADHPELSTTSTIELSTIPALVAKKWCVDQQRIYLTGHSDGGTVSMAISFMTGTKHIPTAIAASAAGIDTASLESHRCPAPLSVMIMHSAKDRLFPGFGLKSTGWWADCNDCELIPDKLDNGCIVYRGCDNGVETWYCEGNKIHSQWPGLNKEIIAFFSSIKKRSLSLMK